jgi:hypothetical protein
MLLAVVAGGSNFGWFVSQTCFSFFGGTLFAVVAGGRPAVVGGGRFAVVAGGSLVCDTLVFLVWGWPVAGSKVTSSLTDDCCGKVGVGPTVSAMCSEVWWGTGEETTIAGLLGSPSVVGG